MDPSKETSGDQNGSVGQGSSRESPSKHLKITFSEGEKCVTVFLNDSFIMLGHISLAWTSPKPETKVYAEDEVLTFGFTEFCGTPTHQGLAPAAPNVNKSIDTVNKVNTFVKLCG